jgi:elongation factor 1-gamma
VFDAGKKMKNPLDELPKSPFVMDDFKREFVNSADKKACLEEHFWKKFDAQGWSIWKVYYQKYEGEGEKVFLTCNLKNGFLQRLDHFRKYSFAVHGVYGDEPNL